MMPNSEQLGTECAVFIQLIIFPLTLKALFQRLYLNFLIGKKNYNLKSEMNKFFFFFKEINLIFKFAYFQRKIVNKNFFSLT